MEISLVRHGRSAHVSRQWITAAHFLDWVTAYDAAGVLPEANHPVHTKQKIAEARLVVTSDLTRSIESAAQLNPEANSLQARFFVKWVCQVLLLHGLE